MDLDAMTTSEYQNTTMILEDGPSTLTNQHAIFSWYPLIITLSYIIIFTSVPGNILVLIAYFRSDTLRNPTNMLIANQCGADAGFCFAAQAFIWGNYSAWGLKITSTYKYSCLVSLAVLNSALFASLLNILSLAIERLIAVLYPLKYHNIMTDATAKIIIKVNWAYVTLSVALPLFGWNIWAPGRKCMTILVYSHLYYSLFFVTPLVCLLVLLTVFNIIIACIAFKKSKVFPVANPGNEEGTSKQGHSTAASKNAISSYKITKMLLLVVGVFYITLIPWVLITTVLVFQPDLWKRQGPPEYILVIHELSKVMVLANTAANPFIYAWRNNAYRTAFKKLLHIGTAHTEM